jgi:hypothetical protein
MANGKSFLSSHGHLLLLTVGIAALAAAGASVVLAPRPEPIVSGSTADPGKPLPPAGLETLQAEFDQLGRPYAPAHTNLLVMVSEIRVACTNPVCKTLLPWSATVCYKCQQAQPKRGAGTDTDGDGVPDTVELSFGMDPARNDVAEDLDKDGFTNQEEIRAGTRPNDPTSHPPLIGKLRVENIGDRPLRFQLKDVTRAGTLVYQQVAIAGVEKLNAQTGEVVNGWKIGVFDDQARVTSISRDGETLKLPVGKVVEKNRRVAVLVSLVDPAFRAVVQPGAKVVVDGAEHAVRDIQESSVVLIPPGDSATPVVVPRLTAADRPAATPETGARP